MTYRDSMEIIELRRENRRLRAALLALDKELGSWLPSRSTDRLLAILAQVPVLFDTPEATLWADGVLRIQEPLDGL